MEMVEMRDNPERAHLERAEREMRQHREEQMRHAEELQQEAKRLLREADEIQAHRGAEQEADELRAQAKRLMAEAGEIRKHVERPVEPRDVKIVYGMPQAAVPRTLVVPLDPMSPEERAGITEDLAVMSRILEKVLPPDFRGGFVDVTLPGSPFAPLLGGQQLPSIYLEGYGAIFFVQVGFPLRGPSPEPEEAPEEEDDALWEETRRELHGPGPGGFMGMPGTGHVEFDHDWGPRRDRFDPERVEQLKHMVLDALRHASRIRALKRSDSVTVVVTGAPPAGPSMIGMRPAGAGFPGAGFRGPGRATGVAVASGRAAVKVGPGPGAGVETVVLPGGVVPAGGADGDSLVIRAAKEDIDALAEGKLDLDRFRELATVIMQ
jgi:hypothetical protein